ncbi:hypothetical protein BsWGS_24507 [Bradybaena similaris]
MACGGGTLTLANEGRENQEFYELAVSFSGEVDLKESFIICKKNPGHLKFISPHNLGLLQLSVKFQCPRSFQLIKKLSDMTVKLSVTFISPNRPRKFPCSEYAGQRKLMVGSGCVTDVDEVVKRGPCPFKDCTETPRKHRVFGYITVVTAAHVVCDDVEARNTTVEFFDDFPDCKTNVRRARGVQVRTVSTNGDFCQLLCVMHEKLQFKTLRKNTFEGLSVMKVNESYKSERKVSTTVSRKTIYFGNEELGGISCRRSLRDVIGLSGDTQKWPCPFKDCREVSGAHEVYGYICVEVAVDVLGEKGVQSPERLYVEFKCNIPNYNSDCLKIRGVKFGSACMLGSSRELLCVVHDRALFELIKYLLHEDKKICLHHRFMSYCEIVRDIFKDRLQIERLSLCVHYDTILCGNIKCDNSESVDTLMSLITYTIPKIEEAFYSHVCSDACIDDKSIPVKARRTIDTASHHIDGIIGWLGSYQPCLFVEGDGRIREQLENLLAIDRISSSSLNNVFERTARRYRDIDELRRALENLLAEDLITWSSLNNVFERTAR